MSCRLYPSGQTYPACREAAAAVLEEVAEGSAVEAEDMVAAVVATVVVATLLVVAATVADTVAVVEALHTARTRRVRPEEKTSVKLRLMSCNSFG